MRFLIVSNWQEASCPLTSPIAERVRRRRERNKRRRRKKRRRDPGVGRKIILEYSRSKDP
jgi:hypothetical protein